MDNLSQGTLHSPELGTQMAITEEVEETQLVMGVWRGAMWLEGGELVVVMVLVVGGSLKGRIERETEREN